MSITFACGNCGKSFTVDDKFAGKKGKCKQCGGVVQIPEGIASLAASGIPDTEILPSRRPAAPSRPTVEDAYGLDEPPRPAHRALPDGIEEVEPGSPVSRRLAARSDGMYAPPKPKKKGSGSTVGLVLKIGLGVVIGLVGIGLASAFISGFVRGFNNARGLSSRATLEAILQERVNLNQELAGVLSGVNDIPSAQAASQKANEKLRAIAANLRTLKSTKALNTDLEAVKPMYQAPQERATQQVIQQIARIAAIEGAWDALNAQGALEELDREEKSIPGLTQVETPQIPAPVQVSAAPDANPTPAPAAKSGGLSSRKSLEAAFQERVNLNKQLASILAGVKDVNTARRASGRAVAKFRAITNNLRKLKVAKGLMTDLQALKQQYEEPQKQASQEVLDQIKRIAEIEGAWDALKAQAALDELAAEEQTIPGMTQGDGSGTAAPTQPQPGADPGPRPGPNSNRPSNNRTKPGIRKGGMNRPNSPGPG
jgi:hypothetical protein